MSLAIGAITKVSVLSTSVQLQAAIATGGTVPYSYQFYRSTVSGFTPGGGNIIGSALVTSTAVAPPVFTDPTVLTPGTVYYYEVIVTDSASATANSAQLSVTTSGPVLSQNQFGIQPFLGQPTLMLNNNTIAAQFDPASTGTLIGGQAVKWSTVANGTPMVVPSTATSDIVAGFVNYNIKDINYSPGQVMEINLAGNCLFLYAALAVNRGQFLTSLPAGVAGGCNGGVIPVAAGSLPIIGYSLDTGAIGTLIRVMLATPPAGYAVG